MFCEDKNDNKILICNSKMTIRFSYIKFVCVTLNKCEWYIPLQGKLNDSVDYWQWTSSPYESRENVFSDFNTSDPERIPT